MKYYIEIGSRVDDGRLKDRIKSWTYQDYADVVITVHVPGMKISESGHGSEKTFSEGLDWLRTRVEELWPKHV